MNNQTLPIPNPTDWLTVAAAAFLLMVTPRTVTRMIGAGVLTGYRPFTALGERGPILLWRAQVNTVLDARLVTRAGRARPYIVEERVRDLESERDADPCSVRCSNPAMHAEGGHDV